MEERSNRWFNTDKDSNVIGTGVRATYRDRLKTIIFYRPLQLILPLKLQTFKCPENQNIDNKPSEQTQNLYEKLYNNESNDIRSNKRPRRLATENSHGKTF